MVLFLYLKASLAPLAKDFELEDSNDAKPVCRWISTTYCIYSFEPFSYFSFTQKNSHIKNSHVKKTFTLYSSITLQKAPASGVPTGFPSYKTVEQP